MSKATDLIQQIEEESKNRSLPSTPSSYPSTVSSGQPAAAPPVKDPSWYKTNVEDNPVLHGLSQGVTLGQGARATGYLQSLLMRMQGLPDIDPRYKEAQKEALSGEQLTKDILTEERDIRQAHPWKYAAGDVASYAVPFSGSRAALKVGGGLAGLIPGAGKFLAIPSGLALAEGLKSAGENESPLGPAASTFAISSLLQGLGKIPPVRKAVEATGKFATTKAVPGAIKATDFVTEKILGKPISPAIKTQTQAIAKWATSPAFRKTMSKVQGTEPQLGKDLAISASGQNIPELAEAEALADKVLINMKGTGDILRSKTQELSKLGFPQDKPVVNRLGQVANIVNPIETFMVPKQLPKGVKFHDPQTVAKLNIPIEERTYAQIKKLPASEAIAIKKKLQELADKSYSNINTPIEQRIYKEAARQLRKDISNSLTIQSKVSEHLNSIGRKAGQITQPRYDEAMKIGAEKTAAIENLRDMLGNNKTKWADKGAKIFTKAATSAQSTGPLPNAEMSVLQTFDKAFGTNYAASADALSTIRLFGGIAPKLSEKSMSIPRIPGYPYIPIPAVPIPKPTVLAAQVPYYATEYGPQAASAAGPDIIEKVITNWLSKNKPDSLQKE